MADDASKTISTVSKTAEKTAQEVADIIEDFATALAAFLDANSNFKPYAEMSKWLKEKNTTFYVSRNNVAGAAELREELLKREIPFIETETPTYHDYGLLIPAPYLQEVADLDQRILLLHCRKKEMTDETTLETTVAELAQGNKDLVHLNNIPEEYMNAFIYKLEGAASGKGRFSVGMSDDKRNICFRPSNVCEMDMEKAKKNRDICDTLIETAIALYGPRRKEHLAEYRGHSEYEEKYYQALKDSMDGEARYIVACGGNDKLGPDTYIQLLNGQEYLYRKNADGEWQEVDTSNQHVKREILSQVKNPSDQILNQVQLDAWKDGRLGKDQEITSYMYNVEENKGNSKKAKKQQNEKASNDLKLNMAIEQAVKSKMQGVTYANDDSRIKDYLGLTAALFERLKYASRDEVPQEYKHKMAPEKEFTNKELEDVFTYISRDQIPSKENGKEIFRDNYAECNIGDRLLETLAHSTITVTRARTRNEILKEREQAEKKRLKEQARTRAEQYKGRTRS